MHKPKFHYADFLETSPYGEVGVVEFWLYSRRFNDCKEGIAITSDSGKVGQAVSKIAPGTNDAPQTRVTHAKFALEA